MAQAFAQSRLAINDSVSLAQIVGQGASSSDFGRKQRLRIEQVFLHRKIVCSGKARRCASTLTC